MKETLSVKLWGKEVGKLSFHNSRGLYYFSFNSDFLKQGINILPIEFPDIIKHPVPVWGNEEKIYNRLPPFIADSLPDRWGDKLISDWASSNGTPPQEATPFLKLSFIGKRGMGALEFEPEIKLNMSKKHIDIKALAELASSIYSGRESMVISPSQELTKELLIGIGGSVGGRQSKAVIAIDNQTQEIRSGQIEGLKDHRYCIIKFENKDIPLPKIELAYYQMATDCGIKMAQCWPMKLQGKTHFVTERFDRKGGEKIYMQTLAGLAAGVRSYEGLMKVCRKLNLPQESIEEVFRRMVFNILANNTDDHNKNISFLMDKNGEWSLAPAYDLTFIFDLGGNQPEWMHCMSVNGKMTAITKEDVMEFGRNQDIYSASKIIKQVADSLMKFKEYADKYELDPRWSSKIENCINANLKSWGFVKEKSIIVEMDGHSVSDIQVECTYKGNFHVYFILDGKEEKYILTPKSPYYETFNRTPAENIDSSVFRNIIALKLGGRKEIPAFPSVTECLEMYPAEMHDTIRELYQDLRDSSLTENLNKTQFIELLRTRKLSSGDENFFIERTADRRYVVKVEKKRNTVSQKQDQNLTHSHT